MGMLGALPPGIDAADVELFRIKEAPKGTRLVTAELLANLYDAAMKFGTPVMGVKTVGKESGGRLYCISAVDIHGTRSVLLATENHGKPLQIALANGGLAVWESGVHIVEAQRLLLDIDTYAFSVGAIASSGARLAKCLDGDTGRLRVDVELDRPGKIFLVNFPDGRSDEDRLREAEMVRDQFDYPGMLSIFHGKFNIYAVARTEDLPLLRRREEVGAEVFKRFGFLDEDGQIVAGKFPSMATMMVMRAAINALE